jgi:hypothetical protein
VKRKLRTPALTKGIHIAANITSKIQGEILPEIVRVIQMETIKEKVVQKRKKT